MDISNLLISVGVLKRALHRVGINDTKGLIKSKLYELKMKLADRLVTIGKVGVSAKTIYITPFVFNNTDILYFLQLYDKMTEGEKQALRQYLLNVKLLEDVEIESKHPTPISE